MQMPAVIDEFVAVCEAAVQGEDARSVVHAALGELVAPANGLAELMPRFAAQDVPVTERGHRLGGEHVVVRGPQLSVMVLDTLSGVLQPPHDHNMTAIIGVFEGGEAQRFWARSDDGIVRSGERLLETGDVLTLGERSIHAISAPGQPARAVHVYLGDIYDVDRSLFDPDTLEEHRFDMDRYDQFCRSA